MRHASSIAAFEDGCPILVGTSPQMRDLARLAAHVARSTAKVLITGESGVGKDLIARYIHALSDRAMHELVTVNCAGLTETLLESELFGHVRGSFTGAHRDKRGKLQSAHRGTIFLDEVGEMSLRMQALLLRFLENGEIQPVGADGVNARVDVRVVAATNRDLSDLVANGQFREDLLYRLKVVHFHVPPLRERVEDIAPLVEHLTARAGRRIDFTPEAWAAIAAYRWPGNVRELHNVLEQLVWLTTGGIVQIENLPPALRPAPVLRAVPARERRRQVADDLFDGLRTGRLTFWDHVRTLFLSRDLTRHDLRELIKRALAATNGNYRGVLTLFGLPESDYKRFLNFLGAHECTVDFREFRAGRPVVCGPAAVPRNQPISASR